MLIPTNAKPFRGFENARAAPDAARKLRSSHDRAVLLLLFLVRPTKTFTLHLRFRATALEFFETLLGFGKFICYISY